MAFSFGKIFGNVNVDPFNASFWDALGNAFTGNLDYKRQVDSAVRAEEVSAREAAKAREHSSQEAEKNRQWQERMSNTAYSRAVADMKSVGLNPYAIGSFGAASTPSGAVGSTFTGNAYSGGSGYVTPTKAFDLLFNLYNSARQEASATSQSIIRILPTLLGML